MSSPTPALIDVFDTFYQFVMGNVLAVNPNRKFGGIVDARDWPPKSIIPEAPYLITLKDVPTRIGVPQTAYSPMYSSTVEWRWAVQGDNIPVNAQAANRGDKYRINFQIMEELLSAHNPCYTTKNQYSVAADVNNNPTKIVTPYDPPEPMWWSLPVFSRRQDRDTGMIFTAAQVELTAFAPISKNI